MKLEIFQIDAFTDTLFGGNPAAVCPLENWLDDSLLLQIAKENNLAETAFYVAKSDNKYELRWFTPEIEMDLCGHATLAAAFVLVNEKGMGGEEIIFETKSGALAVRFQNGEFILNFPARPPEQSTLPAAIKAGLNIQPKEVWKSRDYILLYDTQDDILALRPDMSIMNSINVDPGGISVTAPGATEDVDFVSRFFTPQAAIFEDPVTGSAHCSLTPFWSERLGKTKLNAMQLSERRGKLQCIFLGDRVELMGSAVKYLQGTITI